MKGMTKNIVNTIIKAFPVTAVAVVIGLFLNWILSAITMNAPADFVSIVTWFTMGIVLLIALAIHRGKENLFTVLPYVAFIPAIYALIAMAVTLPELVVSLDTTSGALLTVSIVLLSLAIVNRVLDAMGFKL